MTGDCSWKPQPIDEPASLKASRNPSRIRKESITPAANRKECESLAFNGLEAQPKSENTFSAITGKTQGIRLRRMPPINASREIFKKLFLGVSGCSPPTIKEVDFF